MTDDERRALWAAALGVTREELNDRDPRLNPLQTLAANGRRRRRPAPTPD